MTLRHGWTVMAHQSGAFRPVQCYNCGHILYAPYHLVEELRKMLLDWKLKADVKPAKQPREKKQRGAG